MALANQAALLDELMGVYRNNSVDSKKVMRWEEDIVCKYYLAGFCPYDLFANTKEQLGSCPNHHDQNLLNKYKDSSRYRKMGFEKELKVFLEKFLQRRESRIVNNRERINDAPLTNLEIKKMEIIKKNKLEIDEIIERIESLANQGKIGESQVLFTELEEKKNCLKYDEIDLEKQKIANRIKEDDVCTVCGAMVSKNDPRNGLDNHENGRIHLGYMEIDEVLAGLKELIAKIDTNEDFTNKRKDKSVNINDRNDNNKDHQRGKKHERDKNDSNDKDKRLNKYSSHNKKKKSSKNKERRKRSASRSKQERNENRHYSNRIRSRRH